MVVNHVILFHRISSICIFYLSCIEFNIRLLSSLICINGTAPEYLCDLINLYDGNSNHYLRSNDDDLLLTRKFCHYSKSESAFSISASQIWNELPYYFWSSDSLINFKCALKTYCFNLAFIDVPDIVI